VNASAQSCRIVLVTPADPDRELVSGLADTLRGVPRVRLEIATSLAGARSLLGLPDVALFVVHVRRAGDISGAADLVRASSALAEPVKTVIIGERGQTEAGLLLLRAGAVDYLERPLDLRRFALLVDVLTVRSRLELARSTPAPNHAPADEALLAHLAGPMRRVLDQVRRVAPTNSTILLQGETGTGKTRLARGIHDLSPRRSLPLLVVNCAALSTTLIESEMFGHVRGAFTGAERNRAGKFAEAAGGTLVLDEIDSLPIELQAKLLRVVEERVFEPVGSNTPQPMEARLIATANRSLRREVEAGRFRADLFFRLSVVTFELPPLRDRPDVLPVMIEQFARELGEQAGRPITGVSAAALAAMTAYPWPGNVRELRNVIERAVALMSGEEIEPEDLPEAVRAAEGGRGGLPVIEDTAEFLALTDTAEAPALRVTQTPPPSDTRPTLAETTAEAEAARIAAALRKNNNNRCRTAAELGISRETLYKKLHRYGLFDPTAGSSSPADNASSGLR
jgi:DNA-binding NtrC family response regulator